MALHAVTQAAHSYALLFDETMHSR